MVRANKYNAGFVLLLCESDNFCNYFFGGVTVTIEVGARWAWLLQSLAGVDYGFGVGVDQFGSSGSHYLGPLGFGAQDYAWGGKEVGLFLHPARVGDDHMGVAFELQHFEVANWL